MGTEPLFMVLSGGVFTLVLGIYFLWSGRDRLAEEETFVPTTGLVTRHEPLDARPDDGEDATAWYPVVRFTLPDGTWVEGRTLYALARSAVQVGATEPLLYDPADPTRVLLRRGSMRPRTRGCVSLAAGVAAVGFGVLQLLVGAFLLLIHVLEKTVEG